jgi:general secretion pathway protein M
MNAEVKSDSLNAIKQAIVVFWAERNQRERNMLLAALVVIVAGLFYLLLIDPALSGRKDLEKRLPGMRLQTAELQALAKDAAALSAKASAPVANMTKDSVESGLAKRGLKAQNLTYTGDMAKVQFTGAAFSSLVEWLDEMQKTERVSVVDATVEPQPQLDMVNATLTLRQQKTEQTQ